MHLEIDGDLCTGHGRCYTVAAELVDADDSGGGVVRTPDVPAELEASARLAADSCPERAVRVG